MSSHAVHRARVDHRKRRLAAGARDDQEVEQGTNPVPGGVSFD